MSRRERVRFPPGARRYPSLSPSYQASSSESARSALSGWFARPSVVLLALAAGGIALIAGACSSQDPEKKEQSELGDGTLPAADLVFRESTGEQPGDSTVEPGEPEGAENGDGFEQYIDPPREVSVYCGDGAYDPELEECDDGYGALSGDGNARDVCTSDCQTRDLLAVEPVVEGRFQARRLGTSPHAISGGLWSGALVWTDVSADPQLVVQRRDSHGNRISETVVADATLLAPESAQPTVTSHPAIATLPDGDHVVVYNELNGDGAELGIALARVRHADGSVESMGHANETTDGAQFDADVVWTGEELVVAWTDTSHSWNGPDVRYQTFDEDLSPTGSESVLADSAFPEAGVSV